MKQNTSLQPASAAWTTLQIKEAMLKAGVTPTSIAADSGLTPQAISLAVHDRRRGRRARLAIAKALGKDVTEIWPDALLPMRQRRHLLAS
jgi:lambda repressor-like predicted transcriptional regulator